MKEWLQGVIAIAVSVIGLVLLMFGYLADNWPLAALSFVAMSLAILYGLGLMITLAIRGEKKAQEKQQPVLRTKTTTVYECGKCKRQYINSQTCPYCGSPYRRTIKETTERDTLESSRTKMVR